MVGDAALGRGVQVPTVHGVEAYQGDPQLHVGGGQPVAQQIRVGGQPCVERAQGAQQGGERVGAVGVVGVGGCGALCAGRGPVEVLGAQPLDGLDLRLQTARVQRGTAAAEAPGQVAQDVRGVRADDPPDQSSLSTGAVAAPE